MNKELMNSLTNIIWKTMSARFIVTIALTFIMCWSLSKCFDLITLALSAGDDKTIAFTKDIFLLIAGAIISAFSTAMTLYFTRNDRSTKPEVETPIEEKK